MYIVQSSHSFIFHFSSYPFWIVKFRKKFRKENKKQRLKTHYAYEMRKKVINLLVPNKHCCFGSTTLFTTVFPCFLQNVVKWCVLSLFASVLSFSWLKPIFFSFHFSVNSFIIGVRFDPTSLMLFWTFFSSCCCWLFILFFGQTFRLWKQAKKDCCELNFKTVRKLEIFYKLRLIHYVSGSEKNENKNE